MRPILNALFDTSSFNSQFDRERARVIYGISTIILVVYSVYVIINTLQAQSWMSLQSIGRSILWTFALPGFYVVAALTFAALRRGRLRLAEIGPVVMWFIGGLLVGWNSVYRDPSGGMTLVFFVLLAGLMLRERGVVIGLLVALGSWLSSLYFRTGGLTLPYGGPEEMFSILFLLLGVASITYLFLRYASISRTEGAKTISIERLRLAELTSQIAQRISHRMPLRDVLTNAVEQIRAEFPGIYHAQIFLVDAPKQNARLVASTGEVGRLLIERQHSLPVGSVSVIGQVTASRRMVIARAGSADSLHRRNEFLPDTVVEAAFPLRIGDTIIGALDLQSRDMDVFNEDDAPVFQSLADHIAIAIDNARLFEEGEQRLLENQQLVEQTQRAAEEVERLNQQLTRRFWDDYLSQQSSATALTVDFDALRTTLDAPWTEALAEAAQSNRSVQHQQDGARVVAVPLRVRGQVVGAMEFELDADGQFAPEDLNLIQEVGERLGLAAENIRLFETSQNIAQREALVNEIATRLQASNSVEMALNAAARSLKETVKASRVAIRLGTPTARSAQVMQDEQP